MKELGHTQPQLPGGVVRESATSREMKRVKIIELSIGNHKSSKDLFGAFSSLSTGEPSICLVPQNVTSLLDHRRLRNEWQKPKVIQF
jgi:hypothetical protein